MLKCKRTLTLSQSLRHREEDYEQRRVFREGIQREDGLRRSAVPCLCINDNNIDVMSWDESKEMGYKVCLYCLIGILACLTILFFTCCGSTKSVTEEREIRDSIRFIDQIRDSLNILNLMQIRDSVRIKDSVVTVVDEKGNVKHTKEYHNKEVYHYEKDSTSYYKNQMDSIQSVLDRVRSQKRFEVREKKLTPWQQVKQTFGGYAICFALIIFILLVYRIIRWLRRKSL